MNQYEELSHLEDEISKHNIESLNKELLLEAKQKGFADRQIAHMLKCLESQVYKKRKKLDIKAMKKGAKLLLGTHNFSTFRSSSCQAKSPIKTMKKATVKKNKNQIILTFQSKSFLQQQVRSMVGSLKYLGEGKWNLNDFKKAFSSKKRTMCAPPAPAHGLYLDKVKY